jgi:hypothetical protein
MVGNDCLQVSHQYTSECLFVGVVTHGYYNVRIVPVYLP